MPAKRSVPEHFGRQFGVITRHQALAAGMSASQIDRFLRCGRWVRAFPAVYRSADVARTPEGDLTAACFVTRGRASHESAGALWGLLDRPPPVPTVSVPGPGRGSRPGVVVHRPERPGVVVGSYRNIPCHGPLDTVLDLGAVLAPAGIDDVVDRALARSLVTVPQLAARLEGPSMRHQPGRRRLVDSLEGRGYLGGPTPSVLESRVLRLLLAAGIRPLACEQVVRWEGGHYRLDFTLADRLALEVDGYAYHAGSEAFARDLRRRNRLVRRGWTLLVYSWVDVTREGERVVAEVREALAAHAHR